MNQLSTLLLVDPDPRGLETLTYGFEREGCTVAGTSDPRLARDLLRTTTPQLAVVSLRAPEKPGLDAITGLRLSPPATRIPVMTLGPAALKHAAIAAGTNDFVATPLFLRDVVNVGKLLTLAQSVPNAPHQEVEVQTRLSEYHGLFYLLRALAVTGRSGILLLSRGNRRAELRVSDGAVMAVHIAGLQGLPALHQLLLWEEAALSLKLRPVPKKTNLHLSAQELLDECERFLRDFAHAARDLGRPRCIYVPAPDRDPNTSGLQPSQIGPALRLFDGRRVLTEAIEESPFRVFDTLRVIKRLLESGALIMKSDGGVNDGDPHSMLEQWAIVPDQRGVVGERRRTSRKLKTVGDPPLAAAPIPLTVKKHPGSDAHSTVGELAPRQQLGTPAAVAVLADAATVQVKLDSLPPAAPMGSLEPHPITARHPTIAPAPPPVRLTPTPAARDGVRKTPPPSLKTPPPSLRDSGRRQSLDSLPPDSRAKLKKVLAPARITPSTAFDAVEADFFAREADLYKHEEIDSFDDLDRNNPNRPARPGTKKRR
jgi:CheY-like chemotaxis protein